MIEFKGMRSEPKFMLVGQQRRLPEFKGIFINIDEVYFDHDDGTRETAEEWFKRIVKEAIER